MQYIDRKGNVTIEENGQDKLLRHLYNDWGGKLCLKLLTRPVVSKLGGMVLGSSLSRHLIPGFVLSNKIDLSEYVKKEYTSYNDFFIRQILPSQRPVNRDERVLISPCDGKATVCRIDGAYHFYIKGTPYTVAELLKDSGLAEKFEGGYAVILRLTVDNYHHYCYPASGLKSPQRVIPGCLHTVNPAANEVRQIYHENAREYCLLKTQDFGTMALMQVGAMMVGKITNPEQGSAEVCRGQEQGYFEFGGSTVILLLQRGKVRLDEDLLDHSDNGYETILKMGERIGKSKLPKRTGSTD